MIAFTSKCHPRIIIQLLPILPRCETKIKITMLAADCDAVDEVHVRSRPSFTIAALLLIAEPPLTIALVIIAIRFSTAGVCAVVR
jgi:hypothetical protein